jgi:hypothetical protein
MHTIITLLSYKRTKFVQPFYCQSMTCNATANYFLTLFLCALTFKQQHWHKFSNFCLSFYPHQGDSHWVDFREISYLGFWLKFVETFSFQLESEKNNRQLTWILLYIYHSLPVYHTSTKSIVKIQQKHFPRKTKKVKINCKFVAMIQWNLVLEVNNIWCSENSPSIHIA